MKRGAIWIALICLMVTSLVLASCGTSTSTSTSTPTKTSTSTSTATSTTTPTIAPTTTTNTTTASGNWWDKLGKPQYGGTMTLRISADITNFDPYYSVNFVTIESAWMERLFTDDWTLNPAVFAYYGMFRPSDYAKGQLAQSWEFSDPSTLVVHLRQGIHWQNIPPANGRELTASDIAYHWNRLYNTSTGFFDKGGPFGAGSQLRSLKSVTATDKYTVVLKWNIANPEFIYETVGLVGTSENCIENPEAVAQWGDLSDWHHAIGTGPFILTDFVSGSSATLVKNPDYWGYDERYPQNKLPYIDTLKILIIPDSSTALAGLRAGKIDDMDGMSYRQAQDVQKTNPGIVQISVPAAYGVTLDPRNDLKPFSDLRVRQALQMAIDLPTIANTYYGGLTSPYPVAVTSQYMTGWGLPYTQWSQDLKDQYAYNPTAAKQLLATAGYPNGFNTDIVVDTGVDLDLLQIVKSYFAAIGVNMDIRTMDYPSWVSFVYNGHKEDALAQRSTSGMLGFTYEPLVQTQKFNSTLSASNYVMVKDPVFDAFNPSAIAATSIDQVKQIIIDENKYVAQQHFVISLLQPMTFSLVQPWLKGYNGENNALSGSYGPSFLFFYPARFWIDQDMKK